MGPQRVGHDWVTEQQLIGDIWITTWIISPRDKSCLILTRAPNLPRFLWVPEGSHSYSVTMFISLEKSGNTEWCWVLWKIHIGFDVVSKQPKKHSVIHFDYTVQSPAEGWKNLPQKRKTYVSIALNPFGMRLGIDQPVSLPFRYKMWESYSPVIRAWVIIAKVLASGLDTRGESTCQHRRCRRHPWFRKIPWRRQWLLTPVFLPGKSQGQRSLAGYSACGHGLDWEAAHIDTHALGT